MNHVARMVFGIAAGWLLLVCTGDVHATVVDSRLTGADSLWASGRRDAALTVLDDLVADADTTIRVGALVRRGARRIALGLPRDAATDLARAATLAEARADTTALLPALRWWSLARDIRGDRDGAATLYRRLDEVAAAVGDHRHRGWARVGMASQALAAGDPARADSLYAAAAVFLARGEDPDGVLWAKNGRGIALSRTRRFGEALVVYEEVADLARERGSFLNQANAINNLGKLAMVLGDPVAGQRRFSRAVAMLDSLGLIAEKVVPTINLAMCEQELGRFDRAAAVIDSTLVECRRVGMVEQVGRLVLRQGSLELARGRTVAARRRYREALALGDTLAREDQVRAQVGLARSHHRDGAPDSALAVLAPLGTDRPLDGLGQVGWDVTLLRVRCLLETDRPAAAGSLLAMVEPEIQASDANGYRVLAGTLAGRAARACGQDGLAERHLRRAARDWEDDRSRATDERWREVWTARGQALFLELADLLVESGGERGAGEAFTVLQAYKARTTRERILGPEAGPTAARSAVTLDQLQTTTLRDGEVLLDWYVGKRFGLLFVVAPDTLQVVRLPDGPDLDRRVRMLRELLLDGDERAAREVAGALSRRLFGTADGLIAAADVVFSSPDGSLHGLPLVTLVAEIDHPDREHVHTVTRIPAAALLVSARNRSAEVVERPAVLVVRGIRGEGNAILPGVAREVDDLLARSVDSRLIDLDGSSIGDLEASLRTADVIHIAAHVELDDHAPWRSVVGRRGVSGLTAPAVLAMPLHAELVVLSGCSTAAGAVVPGEGALGLASAFLVAGARCVVATLWPEDDAASARFSRTFYDELARGRTVAAAVAVARSRLLAAGAIDLVDALGIVVLGASDTRIDLGPRPRPEWRPWLAAGLLAGGLLAGGLHAVRQRRLSGRG